MQHKSNSFDGTQLLSDARLIIYRFHEFKEAILNFYIRAVAAYLVSKYPYRVIRNDPVKIDAFERENSEWIRAISGQIEFKDFNVSVALSSARIMIDAGNLQTWEIDFCTNGLHAIAEYIRDCDNPCEYNFGDHGEW